MFYLLVNHDPGFCSGGVLNKHGTMSRAAWEKSLLVFTCFMITFPFIIIIVIIIITRPKPAYGRPGLAGLWGQDTDEVSTFLVFLTSHFAPAALSSDLTNLGPLGKPSFQKSAAFLNIVQKAFAPPPLYLNICPILQGVFFKTRFCRE